MTCPSQYKLSVGVPIYVYFLNIAVLASVRELKWFTLS
jgi:hypothetical protein